MGSPSKATRARVREALQELNAEWPRVHMDRGGRLIGARLLAERVGGQQRLLRALVAVVQEEERPGSVPRSVLREAQRILRDQGSARRSDRESAAMASGKMAREPTISGAHENIMRLDDAPRAALESIAASLRTLAALGERLVGQGAHALGAGTGEAHAAPQAPASHGYNGGPTSPVAPRPPAAPTGVQDGVAGQPAGGDGGQANSIPLADLPRPPGIFAASEYEGDLATNVPPPYGGWR